MVRTFIWNISQILLLLGGGICAATIALLVCSSSALSIFGIFISTGVSMSGMLGVALAGEPVQALAS